MVKDIVCAFSFSHMCAVSNVHHLKIMLPKPNMVLSHGMSRSLAQYLTISVPNYFLLRYWSKLNGDGEIVWGRVYSLHFMSSSPRLTLADPKLTSRGIEQARTIHDTWITEANYGLPPPHNRYTSPLTRALHTASIIFSDVFVKYPNSIYIFEVSFSNLEATYLIKLRQNCREQIGIHTCDKRDSRSYISSAFPDFEIDSSLSEEDELWKADVRETDADVSVRAKAVLDHVFHNFTDATCAFTA